MPTFQAYATSSFAYGPQSKTWGVFTICRPYLSFALIYINSRVKDAGHLRPDFGIHLSLHGKLLNSCNKIQQHTKNSDPLFLFKQNKVINSREIFLWPPHPYPRQSNTRTAKTSSSEEQLRTACTFSSAALMRSFRHRLKRLFQKEPLHNPLQLNSEQSAFAPSGRHCRERRGLPRSGGASRHSGGTFPGGG